MRTKTPAFLLSLAASTCALSARAAPMVYGESSMVKVRPDASARADTGVGLTAGKNEFVSFQVVVQGADSGARNVRAAFSGLKGPSAITGPDVTLYREDFLTTSSPTFPDSATGDWPDALVPDRDEIVGEQRSAFPFNVDAGKARAIWVDVHVPDSAATGVYTGTVQVTADGGLAAKVPVTLTVVGFNLPSTPSLKTAFLLFSGNVCLAHVGDANCNYDQATRDALVDRYVQMGLEHRLSLTNDFSPPTDGNWGHFDATYGPFLDGTTPARLPGAKLTSIQFAGSRDAATYASFAAHMGQRGWLDRAFDYTGDEPPYGISFSDLQSRLGLVRQAAPGLKTLVTTTVNDASANGVLGNIDVMVPVINFLDGDTQPYVGDQRATYGSFLSRPGAELWTYQSCMSQGCAYGSTMPENTPNAGWPSYAVDVSAARNRAMEWASFQEQVTGELYYETAGTLPHAWTDQYLYNANGDGNLFYPGQTSRIGGTTEVPVASIRLKMIRQGIQDYEWLKRVADAGDPGFAHLVAQAVAPNAHAVTDNGAAYDRARLQLISRYLELTHQSAPKAVQGAPPKQPASNPGSEIQNGADPVTQAVSGASAASQGGGGCSAGGGVALYGLPFGLWALGRALVRRRREG